MVLIECFSPVKATDGTADEVNEEVEFKAFTGGEEGAVKKKDELPIHSGPGSVPDSGQPGLVLQ